MAWEAPARANLETPLGDLGGTFQGDLGDTSQGDLGGTSQGDLEDTSQGNLGGRARKLCVLERFFLLANRF